MKTKLSLKETILIASLLFGMFFGAGNLIFPVHLGQLAGKNVILSLSGFIITAVGLPVLATIALGYSRCSGLYELSSRVGKGYGIFFTCALSLTIGPLCAIPRCASTSYTVGLSSYADNKTGLLIFSALFFAVVLFFSLKPGKLMDWIGKYLNPVFLLFFCTLLIVAVVKPISSVSSAPVTSEYESGSFFNGFLEGYNTMDALSGFSFGIIIINSIKNLGVKKQTDIASSLVKSGLLCAGLMIILYFGDGLMGTLSLGEFDVSDNGGIALSQISDYYFGNLGQLFLAITVTLACLKTAIGLMSATAQLFSEMFTHGKKYIMWDCIFVAVAFVISNVGLDMIINLSAPVLALLYPLIISMIFLIFTSKLFNNDRRMYICVTAFTGAAALLDFLREAGIEAVDTFCSRFIPFFSAGFGWVVPMLLGFVIGFIIVRSGRKEKNSAVKV